MTTKTKVSPLTVKCPKCGVGEIHPNGNQILIRGYKVLDNKGHWWSQCLVCAGYYDKDLNVSPDNYNREKGWF